MDKRHCVYHQTVDAHKTEVLVSVLNVTESDVPFQIKGQGLFICHGVC